MARADRQQGKPTPGPAGLVQWLTVLSVLAGATGLAGAAAVLAPAAAQGRAGAWEVVAAAGCGVGGLTLAVLAWAASWLVRSHYETVQLQRRVLSLLMDTESPFLPPVPPPAPASPPTPPVIDPALLVAVRELNASLLMTPEERQAKRRRQQERDGGRLVEQAEAAVAGGDFAGADRLLERLDREFPAEPRTAELRAQLGQARSAAQGQELREATAKAKDLMALAQFDRAVDLAEELVARYPDQPEAAALRDRVRREGQAFQDEQRRRLYAELERHAEQRRWRSALASARLLLERHPHSPEAQVVTMQLATLEDNARIEEVRDLRDRIRDLIERRRYAEAVEVAERVVDRFPGTAAAAELGRQLPRLRELAAGRREGA